MAADILEFASSGEFQTMCVDVTVVDDNVLEDDENVCLTLSSLDPEIVVDGDAAITCVLITNINSK